jgi:hypothetical protein
LLLSPACSSGSTALSTDFDVPSDMNLISMIHSEFPDIFDDLLLDWTAPRDFYMDLGSGSQPAWRVTVSVEEKKVAGIPATKPVLQIGIRVGAADGGSAGRTDALRRAVFTGLGRIQWVRA